MSINFYIPFTVIMFAHVIGAWLILIYCMLASELLPGVVDSLPLWQGMSLIAGAFVTSITAVAFIMANMYRLCIKNMEEEG
jgi:hypothetical protein